MQEDYFHPDPRIDNRELESPGLHSLDFLNLDPDATALRVLQGVPDEGQDDLPELVPLGLDGLRNIIGDIDGEVDLPRVRGYLHDLHDIGQKLPDVDWCVLHLEDRELGLGKVQDVGDHGVHQGSAVNGRLDEDVLDPLVNTIIEHDAVHQVLYPIERCIELVGNRLRHDVPVLVDLFHHLQFVP